MSHSNHHKKKLCFCNWLLILKSCKHASQVPQSPPLLPPPPPPPPPPDICRRRYRSILWPTISSCTLTSTATVCYGDDPSQFPADNIFAAAGDGIWDNGACCGRQYLVRCLSSSPESCIADQTIRVEVINQASMLDSNPSLNGTTMTLSDAAFLQIANKSSPVINIEFTQI
ncbi:putative EG45-like domain containing protein 1 isoform X1 [Dioscorea cayenensis subsp. rotundata]|uniref:EG45-like domain containing protein 1 isoform X1 n=1 Tax=Dioscorea cayennensis subsp. rotundata TaxID=55577 RepID=A0AB40BHK9_DIOCR|nr:putative EG45-like domain containing protein 1 isoform X1 [Dioscorea cayenensis subsp. rotundata]